jgi:putative MATE family efflux protein
MTTTTTDQAVENIYLAGSLPALFAKTASPIILIMLLNGLFTLVDAWFLGAFVGAEALTGVTLMFPLYMLLVALSTLVSSGFSSIFARLLGADNKPEAGRVYGQAILLALLVCAILIGLFAMGGTALTLQVANGSEPLALAGYTYISILIFCSPLVFMLSINVDALRCEGMLRTMMAISVTSAFLNIGFDYLFVVEMSQGVAGSAWGTVLAQACSVTAILAFRVLGKRPSVLRLNNISFGWQYQGKLLALGAPTSLGYIGISLSAGLTLYCLQIWSGPSYAATAGAFGIITRLMTFTFLPLLGLSLAFQTIVGNNFGAGRWQRSNHSLRAALLVAIVYCVLVQAGFLVSRQDIGLIFVDDPAIVAEIARILPLATFLLFVFGPLMMISTYFQAIGDAGRAALLGLSRTYLFALPLTFALPFVFGEPGIWYGGIVAEVLMLVLTIAVLRHRARRHGHAWGLYQHTAPV